MIKVILMRRNLINSLKMMKTISIREEERIDKEREYQIKLEKGNIKYSKRERSRSKRREGDLVKLQDQSRSKEEEDDDN